jgi:hypothetical protein
MLTDLRTGPRKYQDSFFGRGRDFSLLQNSHTDSGRHHSFYMVSRLGMHGGVLLLQHVSAYVMVLSDAQGQNCGPFSPLNALPLFNSDP